MSWLWRELIGPGGYSAGYPIISHFTRKHQSTNGAFNVGGTNATGQVPDMPGGFSLIDKDTPKSAFSMPSWNGREEMELVFSDEFNTDGRTFYPGDDPYWEAVDLHYWQTVNWEWYDPSSITTAGGNLVITLKREDNHKLKYMGGKWVTRWTAVIKLTKQQVCFNHGEVLSIHIHSGQLKSTFLGTNSASQVGISRPA
jgi:hypothetical protein